MKREIVSQDLPAPARPGKRRIRDNSLSLFDGLAIVCRMAHDQKQRDRGGCEGADAAHDQGQLVECDAAIPERDLVDC